MLDWMVYLLYCSRLAIKSLRVPESLALENRLDRGEPERLPLLKQYYTHPLYATRYGVFEIDRCRCMEPVTGSSLNMF